MKIEKFEDIMVWQKAKEFTIKIYLVFENSKDFSFKSQIQRASISVMNNIAEGFERKTNKELVQFLYISKGSAGEVRSMLHLALDLGFITKEQSDKLISDIIEISKMLSGFIKSLKT